MTVFFTQESQSSYINTKKYMISYIKSNLRLFETNKKSLILFETNHKSDNNCNSQYSHGISNLSTGVGQRFYDIIIFYLKYYSSSTIASFTDSPLGMSSSINSSISSSVGRRETSFWFVFKPSIVSFYGTGSQK